MEVGGKTFKVHLDGYNITDSLAGKGPNPRHEFSISLTMARWRPSLRQLEAHVPGATIGRVDVWQEPFVPMRLPKICNLRSDPFEQAHEIGIGYPEWRINRAFLLVPAQRIVGRFLATFKEFPPSQKVGSFSLDHVMEAIASGMSDK